MNKTNIIELPPLSDFENEPIFFDEIETPEIPTYLLPGVLQEFTHALSEATETPSALSIMTVLGVVSATAARYFRVSPKPGWKEPLNIYTLIALPPANNKTLVMNQCTQPLINWEQEQAARLQSVIKEEWSEHKTQEKIIEAMRAKSAKAKTLLEQKDQIKEIAQKEAELIQPQILPQVFANDVTPESLATHVHEQGGHFAIFSDEGGVTEALGGLYSGGTTNIDILLKGIDGGHLRVRRKERSFDLNPYLTIVLTVQPIIIQNMCFKKSLYGQRHDGTIFIRVT